MLTRAFMPILLLAAVVSSAAGGDKWGPFLGVWEYRQKNLGSQTGFDDEGERLEFKKGATSIDGLYFGLERMGEHGLFYTAVPMADLSLDDAGALSFTVPSRSLYYERPQGIQEAQRAKTAGHTAYELEMRGKIVDGRLTLSCRSPSGDCPEEEMIFGKGLR